MKILVCPNAFKESLSAVEASQIITQAFKTANFKYELTFLPLSDGGDSFIDSILNSTPDKIIPTHAHNAYLKKTKTDYALINNGQTAIIEVAKIIGLAQIQGSQRNPQLASSFGVGEVIINALERKVKKIIIGLGGSATNDGGAGMLQALGAQLLDKNNGYNPWIMFSCCNSQNSIMVNFIPKLIPTTICPN